MVWSVVGLSAFVIVIDSTYYYYYILLFLYFTPQLFFFFDVYWFPYHNAARQPFHSFLARSKRCILCVLSLAFAFSDSVITVLLGTTKKRRRIKGHQGNEWPLSRSCLKWRSFFF